MISPWLSGRTSGHAVSRGDPRARSVSTFCSRRRQWIIFALRKNARNVYLKKAPLIASVRRRCTACAPQGRLSIKEPATRSKDLLLYLWKKLARWIGNNQFCRSSAIYSRPRPLFPPRRSSQATFEPLSRSRRDGGGASEIQTDSTVYRQTEEIRRCVLPQGYLMRFVSVRDPSVTLRVVL